jgi:hypothetical protein
MPKFVFIRFRDHEKHASLNKIDMPERDDLSFNNNYIIILNLEINNISERNA